MAVELAILNFEFWNLVLAAGYVATTGRAQPGVSYGRYRGVLRDTGTACNHHEIG